MVVPIPAHSFHDLEFDFNQIFFFRRQDSETAAGWMSPDVVSVEYSLPGDGILSDAESGAGGTVLCHSAGISFQLNIIFWGSRWRRDVLA